MKNLAKAVISVMRKVKGIDKTATIGTGSSSYKGVPDQEVKKIIGEAMSEAGLCILPIDVRADMKIERWEQVYNGQSSTKQSVFTEVNTRYLLLHESGESIELCGYGQGIDTQDKGAGKATTYALKYALLYTFLVPTGKIDDADAIHSDSVPVPSKQVQAPAKRSVEDLRANYYMTVKVADHVFNSEEMSKFLVSKTGINYKEWSETSLIKGIDAVKKLIAKREEELYVEAEINKQKQA